MQINESLGKIGPVLQPPFFHCLNTRNKSKSFKPKKSRSDSAKAFQLKNYAEQTLGSGNLRAAVLVPEGEDQNEWLAVNSELRASLFTLG